MIGVGLFVVTNIDTLIVLVAFCIDPDYRAVEILTGHYIGFSIGLAAAIFGATLATEVFYEWTFTLGLIPMMIGVWGLIGLSEDSDQSEFTTVPSSTGRIGLVSAATIGLTGENLAVYIPFFATLSSTQLAAVSITYIVGAAVIFGIALVAARRTERFEISDWLDRRLVPVALILVGLYVVLTGWFAA